MALAEKKFEVVNAWETNATDDPLPAFAILPRLRITIVRRFRTKPWAFLIGSSRPTL
jgi:hypothetical protein